MHIHRKTNLIMASKLFSLSNMSLVLISFVIFLSFFSASLADPPPSSPISSRSLCKSTQNPSFCTTVLPSNQNGTVYYYGRYSIRQALSASRKFLNLVQNYLRNPKTLSTSAIRALQDCEFLAQLNMEYLTTYYATFNTNTPLPTSQADNVQTFLSAILTNQQTCLDGISSVSSAWNVKNGLYTPLSNDTKLYGLSLDLFTKGWVPKNIKKKTTWTPTAQQRMFSNGRLPLKMSDRTRNIYESVSGRKLLQTDDEALEVSDIVVVSQDGTGNFTLINDAVASAPNNSDGSSYFLIYIVGGVYGEYVSIPKNKKYLMMMGDGINQTVITGNHSYVDGWTTFNSATFAVVAPGFVAVNITFQNTAGAVKHQAVAVRNGADLSTFYLCSFEGYQDTLYAHSLRQFYRECDIYGTVDFIFGNAAAVFQNCNMYPRLPMQGQFNAITAQGRTDPNQNTGYSILNCTVRAADDLAESDGSTQTYLGRPWKEYSRTVYMESFLGSWINPAGWSIWSGDFALNTSYYAEFNNSGPGSDTSNRVTWPGFHIINQTDALNFTVANFLIGDAWLPQTGVPYFGGLL